VDLATSVIWHLLTGCLEDVASLILRLVTPVFSEHLYNCDVHLSSKLWLPAFILFLIGYAPTLWRGRPGGKSG